MENRSGCAFNPYQVRRLSGIADTHSYSRFFDLFIIYFIYFHKFFKTPSY